jgi:hypothetical protein
MTEMRRTELKRGADMDKPKDRWALAISAGREGGRWRYANAIQSNIPFDPGVYVVFAHGRPIYIGSASRLRARILNGHRVKSMGFSGWLQTPWGDFQVDKSDGFHIRFSTSRKYGDWAMRELRLIRRLRPAQNKNHKPREAAIG